MQCPGGPNTWPSFWLLDQPSLVSPSSYSYGAEIDVTESYGNWGTGPGQSPAGNPNYSSTTWHRWGLNGNSSTSGSSYSLHTGMTTGYHTYGVDIEPTTTTWYFDRVQVWQQTTIDAAQRPMYLLLNLALGGGNYNNSGGTGYDWSLTTNPSDLKVQYVAVWASPNSPNYVASGGSNAIGVSFYDSSTGGSYSPGNQTLTSTDVAGAGSGSTAGWYNNIDVASTCPTNVVLKDSSGTNTSATLSVKPSGTALDGKSTSFWAPWNGTSNATSNILTATQRLYNGNLGTANNSGYATELALANIPYSSYDIYVYVLTSVYTSGSAQIFQGGVSGGAGTTYYFAKGVAWAPGDHLPTTYTQATATAVPSTYGANYVKFSNLSGSAQTIDVVSSTESGLSGAIGVTGIQIVPHGGIGVSFYDSSTGGSYSPSNQTLASTDSVGASAMTGWNNNVDVASTCPTNLLLKDTGGVNTTATLSVKPSGTALDGKSTSFFAPWNGTSNTTSNSLTSPQRLFNGNLGTANNNGYATELALANIPYANYDVYVYVLTSVYTSGSAQIFQGGVSGGAGTTYYFAKGVAWAPGDHLPTSYTQATATALPSTYGSNYVKFSNLSGSAQTIDVVSSTESGLSGAIGVTGIQIVPH
jgi:hypothetical protein